MKTNTRLLLPIFLILGFSVALIAWALIKIALAPSDDNKNQQVTVTPNNFSVEVIKISEQTFDDKPTLAILFSTPLDPKIRYDNFIETYHVKKGLHNKLNGSWVLSDNRRVLYFPHIKAQTHYYIKVLQGLPASNGKKSKLNTAKTIKTKKVTAIASFASRGNILPARLNGGLPIVTVNTPEVDIQFLRVKPNNTSKFLSQFSSSKNFNEWQLDQMKNVADSVYQNRFVTRAQKNKRTITHIPVKNIKELSKPGMYIAVMTIPGKFDYYKFKTSLFLVTDIGLHARVYKENFTVYASSLATGASISNLKLQMIDKKGKQLEEVTSDADGVATFSSKPAEQGAIIAIRGKEFSLLSFKDPALDLSEFNVKGSEQNPTEAFVYSNRDLFRPGDRADFSVVLRDYDGHSVKAQPLKIKVKRPDGRVIRNLTLKPGDKDKLGYYYYRFNIPGNAQTGKWSLEVITDPALKKPASIHKFNVEEFLPERMKLDLASAKKYLTLSELFVIQTTGAYLYGAPAAGNRVKAVLNRYMEKHPVKKYKDYFFGDIADEKNRERDEITDDKLDKRGQFTITVAAPKGKTKSQNSAMTVRVTTSIFESGGRPVTRSIKRVVWPAKTLIGVRPLFTGKNASDNSNVEFEVIKVNPEGRRLAASNLEVKLIREDRNYHWEHTDQRGWHYEFTQDEYPVVVQNLNINANNKAKVSVPVEWGSYRLEITDPDTQRKLSHRFSAGYGWEQKQQSANARPDMINITLDYKGGDTADVKLVPPKAGKGILFIESDKLLYTQRIDLPAKGKTFKLKIPNEWKARHDIYISAIVFRPGANKNHITPNRSVGTVHLPFARDDRKLSISMDLPEKMQPDRPLKVKIKIANLKNKKAMVTVSAVDMGILNITDYKTPDPFKYFFAKRRYGVQQYDLYGKVIENLKGVEGKLRFGGDGVANKQNKRPDAKVKTVALFSGAVMLDKHGEATVELKVPDYNGSLRVMAVAFTNDKYGSSEREIIVAAPIIAEISMPRFISPGDKSRLTLDLHNLSGKTQTISVDVSASFPLKMEKSEQKITLTDKEKKILTFDLHGGEDFGVGKIQVNVNGSGIKLERQWELGVRPAYPGVRRVVNKVIQPGEDLVIDKEQLENLMSSTVDGTLVVSTTPPLNIRGAVKGLLSYPYGCLEQTTSKAFPLVYINKQKALQYGLKAFSDKQRAEMIAKSINRIRSMQRSSGGFGLWNNRSPEEPWLTPYVTHFLLEAKDNGFSVPADMLQSALKNLEKRISTRRINLARHFHTEKIRHLAFASNAYAGYALARVQRAPLGTLRTLFKLHHKESESGLPLIHLGLALKLQGDTALGMKSIKLGLKKTRESKRYLGDYGSPARDMAMSYALLAKHGIKDPGADKLVFSLGKKIQSSNYLSTQEQLAIFLAGNALSKNKGKQWNATLVKGDKSTALDYSGRMVKRFDFKDINNGLQLKSTTQEPLYAMFVTTGYPKKAPKLQNKYIDVVRTLYDMQGKKIERKQYRVGELFIAHLSVRGDKRTDNALVVDLLPAGFEIENLNISKGENFENIKINGKHPKTVMNNAYILHQEYRDDRFAAAIKIHRHRSVDLFYLVRVVSPGIYKVPPTLVEDMYSPEWRGIGSPSEDITVVNKAL